MCAILFKVVSKETRETVYQITVFKNVYKVNVTERGVQYGERRVAALGEMQVRGLLYNVEEWGRRRRGIPRDVIHLPPDTHGLCGSLRRRQALQPSLRQEGLAVISKHSRFMSDLIHS